MKPLGDRIIGPHQANLVLIAYASSEGSGEPAHPRSLARTFASRSYKQWIKRNLQTESQIPGPSEWLVMHSLNLSWGNARRHKFAWRGPIDNPKEVAKFSGFSEVLLDAPMLPCHGSVAESNRLWAIFWAWTEDWLRLIWSLRGFIGLWEVSAGSYFHRRLVSVCAAVASIKIRVRTICNLLATVTDHWCGGDWSALHQQLVGHWLLSGFWARQFIPHWVCMEWSVSTVVSTVGTECSFSKLIYTSRACARITSSFWHKF